MTPKEKAEELVSKFRILCASRNDENDYCEKTRVMASKRCALICVDEMQEEIGCTEENIQRFNHLEEVKQEIEKL